MTQHDCCLACCGGFSCIAVQAPGTDLSASVPQIPVDRFRKCSNISTRNKRIPTFLQGFRLYIGLLYTENIRFLEMTDNVK